MKVLHVLSTLDAGGVEAWLKDLAVENKRQGGVIDISLLLNDNGERSYFFEDEVLAAGVDINKLASPKKAGFLYPFILFRFLRKGAYDAVHSHSYLFSGVVLFVAWLAGVKIRIAHSHNNIGVGESGLGRKAYFILMKLLIRCFSTLRLAVSEEAGKALFGNVKYIVFPCGLDFEVSQNKQRELNIDIDLERYYVISHVGSFSEQKNHKFIAQLARKIRNKKINGKEVLFLFIGDGVLKPAIEEDLKNSGASSLFLGLRDDVKEVLYKYADVFIFPSRFEGLGLVSLEAQSQGVYCVHSEFVPKAAIVTNHVEVISIVSATLGSPVDVWAERLIHLLETGEREKKIRRCEDSNKLLVDSSFSIENNLRRLTGLYNASF